MPLSIRRSILATTLRCAAGIVLLSSPSWADTESFTSSGGAGYLGGTNDPTNIKLPSFNPNLGTLESIDISLKYNVCPNYVLTNTTSATIAYSGLGMSLPITSAGPGGLDLTTTATNEYGSSHAKPGVSSFFPERQSTFDAESVDPTDFALYEVLNQKLTFVITPGPLNVQGTAASPGLSFAGTAKEWAGITVTYTYLASDAAPEPSGRLLSLIAGVAMVVGIGSRLRRRTLSA